MRRILPAPALGLAAILAIAGCSLVPSPSPGAWDIHVENGTTLEVRLFVNGALAGTFEPGKGGVMPADRAGPLPWRVEARTASGRVLVAFPVEPARSTSRARRSRAAAAGSTCPAGGSTCTSARR